MTTPADPPDPDGSVVRAPDPTPRGSIGVWQIAATRLRFLFVFAAIFAVIGGWETIRTYWSRLTTISTQEPATSSDTEFFCPMDPGILSDWPSKCPVCNMTLVRRKRGEAVPLPEGVMARMQFTPYRLWLGGIRTEPVDFAPLARTLELPGVVRDVGPSQARVEANVFARELTWIEPSQAVEVVSADEPGRSPCSGTVKQVPNAVEAGAVGTLVVAIEGDTDSLHAGERLRVRIHCPVDRLEPFRGQPTVPPPLDLREPRRLYACMEHAEVVREAAGKCPRDGLDLMARPLRDNQRVRWWCPMHPGVVANRAGSKCEACGGMILVPRVVTFRPPGGVLAIPASAAIDEGTQSLVYLDRGAGMFDAKVVVLGPRCGAMFPVVSGLEPGDRVASQGAFLIDAESRLNPSLATGYFGAGRVAPVETPDARSSKAGLQPDWLAKLAESDRHRAVRQELCPVTGKPLGSMGVPPRLSVRGRVVFLCCDGCTAAIEGHPEEYLAKLPRDVGEGPP